MVFGMYTIWTLQKWALQHLCVSDVIDWGSAVLQASVTTWTYLVGDKGTGGNSQTCFKFMATFGNLYCWVLRVLGFLFCKYVWFFRANETLKVINQTREQVNRIRLQMEEYIVKYEEKRKKVGVIFVSYPIIVVE